MTATITNPMEVILQNVSLKTTLFPPTSRYHGIDTATMEIADGKTVIYLRRRFVPSPERFELIQEHTVTEGDRLDNVTAHYLGDPEQFWRIADANNAMNPFDLTTEPGTVVRVPIPQVEI